MVAAWFLEGADAIQPSRDPLRGGPARQRPLQLLGRNDGRAGGYAGVHQPPDIAILIHCRNRNLMVALVNRHATTAIVTVVVTLIGSLNVFLLYQTFFG
jgi:hypothetical protein